MRHRHRAGDIVLAERVSHPLDLAVERSSMRFILIAANLLIGVLLLLMSWTWFKVSPMASIIFLAAALDQFEDVYYLSTGRSLLPKALAGFDIGAELLQFIMGVAILLLGISYIGRLEYSMLPHLTVLLGFAVCVSSIYDIMSMQSRHRVGAERFEGVHQIGLQESGEENRRRILRNI